MNGPPQGGQGPLALFLIGRGTLSLLQILPRLPRPPPGPPISYPASGFSWLYRCAFVCLFVCLFVCHVSRVGTHIARCKFESGVDHQIISYPMFIYLILFWTFGRLWLRKAREGASITLMPPRQTRLLALWLTQTSKAGPSNR